MRRTQIYITEEQDRRLGNRARDGGVPKAKVIRDILDDALGIDDNIADRQRAIEATAGLLPEADDWGDWLRRVRGSAAGADERLRQLEARPLETSSGLDP